MANFFQLCFMVILFPVLAQAELHVLFNPHDPTLKKIGEWIESAQSSIDIAIYNIDVVNTNPVIASLQTPKVQGRIKSGRLKIRLIFEGYESPDEKYKIMSSLEDLGVEVRQLNSGLKMHHKFAVFDPGSRLSRVVSGSGNWSLTSQNNYNENAFFFTNEPVVKDFQQEFNTLWEASADFVNTDFADLSMNTLAATSPTPRPPSLNAFFNSKRFIITKDGIKKNKSATSPELTQVLVGAIDQAQKEILIASTRLKLEPIYAALQRAAQRNVQVKIIVSQDDYKCHGGISYSRALSLADFPGHERIDVRVKYYHLDPCEYMRNQMHHKYMIVDRSKVYSGSFNWSLSGENNHLENIIYINSRVYPRSVNRFVQDFQRLWGLNRVQWPPLLQKIQAGRRICAFNPMVLEFKEVDQLLQAGRKLHCRVTK